MAYRRCLILPSTTDLIRVTRAFRSCLILPTTADFVTLYSHLTVSSQFSITWPFFLFILWLVRYVAIFSHHAIFYYFTLGLAMFVSLYFHQTVSSHPTPTWPFCAIIILSYCFVSFYSHLGVLSDFTLTWLSSAIFFSAVHYFLSFYSRSGCFSHYTLTIVSVYLNQWIVWPGFNFKLSNMTVMEF